MLNFSVLTSFNISQFVILLVNIKPSSFFNLL